MVESHGRAKELTRRDSAWPLRVAQRGLGPQLIRVTQQARGDSVEVNYRGKTNLSLGP
jgi:hypothetical protein